MRDVIIGFKHIPENHGIQKSLNVGAIGSLLAIMNTASEVGMAALSGFKSTAGFLPSVKIGGSLMVSEFFTVNILSGITGPASGRMSIAPGIMSKEWPAWPESGRPLAASLTPWSSLFGEKSC